MSGAERRHPSAVHPYPQPDGTGPNGRRLCRWCHGEVAKGRSTWCSDACVEEYRGMHDWNHIRGLVLARDRGVCALCRCDTKRVDTERAVHCAGQWEADHIVARSEGGIDHMSNLRTLCVPCHRARTAVQRARWAAEKRGACG